MSLFIHQQLMLASLVGLAVGQAASGDKAPAGGASGGGGGSSHGPPPKSPAQMAAEAKADAQNRRYGNDMLIILAAVVVALGFYRVVVSSVRYIRALACLNNKTQRYFQPPPPTFARIKQHLLYAPLFRSRHSREFRLFSMNLGTLPSRFQSLFFFGVIAMNVSYCVYDIPWHGAQQEKLSSLRNRSGVLAVVNMIPLVLLAGRNNPLIVALNISFDAFNRVHRTFGRMVMIEAVVHSVAQIMIMVESHGWAALPKTIAEVEMIKTGVIGTVAMVAIVILANSILRQAFYEIFLHLHIALIILCLVVLWKHLHHLPERTYLDVVIAIWAIERSVRVLILVYRNFGRGGTKAVIETLPGDAVRVSLKMARPWRFRPGQHVFLTIPSVGLWTSHPFSVAWSHEDDQMDSEKGSTLNGEDVLATAGTTMSLVVRRRAGFTDGLHAQVAKSNGHLAVNAFVEGPYGGHQNLNSYGTVVFFAGGVGITHQVPFVRDLVTGFAEGTVAARRVLLVWVIQSPEHLEWIRPFMTSILAMDNRRDVLRIQLFITRPRSTKEIHSPSATVQMFPGKPNVDTLVQMECENQIGAMGVSVCGTGSLTDDVRDAVRSRQGWRNIDFFEESYSW
ncbi:hypothetical protein MMC07_007195 [Pseudocyphellaria aurata]|nr:hypothetical protein [Pseudocyphellaria aurata]